ncbi:MAG TPA: LysM peptidoglycan-binding domain-containing protein [Gammaproteobacteria bacterium]|nr:LysM peptidoglycan-binding domain-containing protein [Gammaproteobacteria bacterium]
MYRFIHYIIATTLLSCLFIWPDLSFSAPMAEGIQVYKQNNVQLIPEHKQKLADDITRYRNADNLWDVLRDEFTLEHYDRNPQVQEKIQWFMNNQDYLLRSASRAAPYLYYILQQVKKRHLPAELVLLPIIESGFNPFSLSPVGAAGIWQLMPGTASNLGVKKDWWYDGRRDIIASTRAALNYLAYLQSFFEGNWLLAIAAYNTGEGNVLSAIKRNIRDGRDTDFWSLPVAQQTRDYVPSLLALAVIISNPNRYPVYFPPVRNAPYLGQVDVSTSHISLQYAAELAGISLKKMMQLNPGFNRPSTSPNKLVLPIENVAQFTENLARTPLQPQIEWLHYKVKSGDSLAMISKKFNTTAIAIRKMNHLNKVPLHSGTNLLIPVAANSASSLDQAQNAPPPETKISKKVKHPINYNEILVLNPPRKYTLKPGDTVYMVRKKDTIQSIAKRFHVHVAVLQSANRLHAKVKPGMQLVIPHRPTQSLSVSPGDTVYMVRQGDTIEKIAKQFHITPAAIRSTNLIDNASLSAGESIIVPVHRKA